MSARDFRKAGPLWLLAGAAFLLSILLGFRGAQYAPDSGLYRFLASGQRSLVPAPFSGRILAPSLAGWLGHATGLGVENGFLILGLASLAVLLTCVALLLRVGRVPSAICAAILLMPFWADLFHNYYLPDLLHAALLAAILLCLAGGQFVLAMLLLFPAYMARESTLLVAVCLGIAAWRRLPLRAIAGGIVAIAAGAFVARHFIRLGAMNIEGLGSGPYMAGKFVWSFSRNILGLSPWTNTLDGCSPVWTMAVPEGWRLGSIRFIGMCHPSLWGPARTLLSWFGIFGIGPALAFRHLRSIARRPAVFGELWNFQLGKERGNGMVVVYRFCLIYGVIAVLLAPLLGASTDRLVEYGWPFFFVCVPWFLAEHLSIVRGKGTALFLLHLFTCWIAWIMFRFINQDTLAVFTVGLVVLALNGAAYLLLRSPTAIDNRQLIADGDN